MPSLKGMVSDCATPAPGRIVGAVLLALAVCGCPGAADRDEDEDLGAPSEGAAERGERRDAGSDAMPDGRAMPDSHATDSSPTAPSFTPAQICKAAQEIKTYIEANRKPPGDVTMGSSEVTMPQFLRLAVHETLELENGSGISIALANVAAPSKPTETLTGGELSKTEFLDLARTIKSHIGSTGRAPDSVKSRLGSLRYETLVYLYSRVLAFYSANSRLPNYVSVEPWATTTSDVQQTIEQIGEAEAKFRNVQGVCSHATCFVQLGYGDCWASSEWLYNQLAKHKLQARIMRYYRGYGCSYPCHAWVQINLGSGWKNWDYKKFHSHHHGDVCGTASYVLIPPGKTSAYISGSCS